MLRYYYFYVTVLCLGPLKPQKNENTYYYRTLECYLCMYFCNLYCVCLSPAEPQERYPEMTHYLSFPSADVWLLMCHSWPRTTSFVANCESRK
jgi:hypothetical protein